MKNVADTRTRLVEVAMDLIWPRSYGSASVDMICKAAGVFQGSYYHFFPSLFAEASDPGGSRNGSTGMRW
jgi:AcrR family transcriptional regulator